MREVATALVPELGAIGTELERFMAERLPEMRDVHAEDLVFASIRANTMVLVDALSRGVPLSDSGPTTEVTRLTRRLVERGLALPAVMRGYRLGELYWIDRWSAAVTRHAPAGSDRIAVITAGITYTYQWVELITDRLAEEYRSELERLAREAVLTRATEVRRILTESDVDAAAATARLGYSLAARHLALVLRDSRADAGSGRELETAAERIVRAVAVGSPLVVRVNIDTLWCWLPCAESPPAVPAPAPPVLLGQGRPHSGLDGFRRGHAEAMQALRIAELAAHGPGTVTTFDDVAVSALCTAEPQRCRDFVRTELHGLCDPDQRTAGLRETLAVFYDTGSSLRATAVRLNIHHNTVRYRLEQAEKKLRHPVAERRLAVELALHLLAALGPFFNP